jgi:anti-anti-sigma regulatory factor
MLTIESAERSACLTLPDRADVSSALAIYETLLRANLDSIDSLEIDASAVSKTDVAALQLLLAWLSVLDSQHMPWRWRNVSDSFRQIVDLAGLSKTLRLVSA